MAISKSDLLTHTFSKKILGYRPSEVDATLREAAETLGRLAEERAELQRRLGEMERDLREYKQREATLRDTLLTTQAIVVDMKEKARIEAEGLVDEPRRRAEALFEEARARVAGEKARLESLARQRERFEQRMRDLLLAHARLLNAPEDSRELDGTGGRAIAGGQPGDEAGGDFVFGEDTA